MPVPVRESDLPNDAFLAHKPQVSGRSVKKAPEARELTNPTHDPFMINQTHGAASRPRIKVRILGANGLPQRGSNVITYGTCMAQYKKTSMFRTSDSHDSGSPVWDELGQMVNRWVPGDVLLFRIFDKDRSGLISNLMASETVVAQCEIRSDEYYPNGLRGASLPLFTSAGSPIPGAQLQVEVDIYGVKSPTIYDKIMGYCDCANWNCGALWLRIRHAPEAIIKEWYSILGEPADGRTKSDMVMLIGAPLIVFLLLTWLGWLLRHVNSMVIYSLDGVAFCIALGAIVTGMTTHKYSRTPFFALGCLSLLAVIMALATCEHGWNDCWRQWWWMHTGHKLGASASTPALARSDASVITFDTVKNGTAWTSVDSGRAAGYRKGDIYCAAPILDPTVANGDIIRVEYWAIGINCCNDFGSFTCDSAREMKGSVGVVMKGDGMPCAGCHETEFRLAALKSAGMNHMVSAPGAMYVRYVSNAKKIEDDYLAKCVSSVFWSLLLGLALFGFLGFLTNYKSWGKIGHFPLYNLLNSSGAKKARATHQEAHIQDPTADALTKKWILKLSPDQSGAFSVAAIKPQDDNAISYATL